MLIMKKRGGAPDEYTNLALVFLAISFFVIMPNLMLFSTDDLFIFIDTGLKGKFSLSQAGEGRYTFAAVCQAIRRLGFSTNSYIVISNFAFCASLSILFVETLRFLQITSRMAQICGFLSFIIFGFNFDLYQFVFAQLSYGIAFMGLALSLRIADTKEILQYKKIVICSVVAALSIGSYQIYVILCLLLVSSLLTAAIFRNRLEKKLIDTVITLVLSDLFGSLIYFLINFTLHVNHVSAFTSYPRREQGIRFLGQNIQKFASTAHALLVLNDHNVYSPLLPLIVKLSLYWVFMVLCFGLTGPKRAYLTMFGVVTASLILWVDPVNMLLSSYWPSARSMSSFCIFVGVAVAVIAEKLGTIGGRTRMQSFVFAIIVVLIFSEAVTGVMRLRDRFIRQNEDLILAQAITSNILQRFSGDDVVQITIGAKQDASSRHSENVFDYGRSLFQTSWSAPALIDYVSNGRINATYDHNDECKSLYDGEIAVYQQYGRMLVCIRYE